MVITDELLNQYNYDNYLSCNDISDYYTGNMVYLHLRNISPSTQRWLDASNNNDNMVPYTQVTSFDFNCPYKCYGTWANNIGSNNVYTDFSIACDKLGSDIAFTDINGNTVYGFCGAPYQWTNSNGVVITGTLGGRGTPYKAGVSEYAGLVWVQGTYADSERNKSVILQLANNQTTPNDSPTITCEYRDLSQDEDCPTEVTTAINWLSYQRVNQNWQCLVLDQNSINSNKLNLMLQRLGHKINVGSRLLMRASVWIKRLDNPLESTPEYALAAYHIGGLSGNTNKGHSLLVDLPKTWVKVVKEFIISTTINYYWQFNPSFSAWVDIADKTKRTTNEPIVAFANPRLEIIKVYDVDDPSKEIILTDSYNRHYPKYIETFNIGDTVL
jgi:hypothetical protein